MPIDIQQLPIPDWGLHCPQCNYSLHGLPSHTCPECGLELEIANVIQSWHRLREPEFTGDELPVPDWGLQCRKCNASLFGSRTYECERCNQPFTMPQKLRPQKTWFEVSESISQGLSDSYIELLLFNAQIPHRREQSLQFLLQAPKLMILAHRDFYFDVLHLLASERRRLAEGRAMAQNEKVCPTCGKQNPGNFAICWSCGGPLDSDLDQSNG